MFFSYYQDRDESSPTFGKFGVQVDPAWDEDPTTDSGVRRRPGIEPLKITDPIYESVEAVQRRLFYIADNYDGAKTIKVKKALDSEGKEILYSHAKGGPTKQARMRDKKNPFGASEEKAEALSDLDPSLYEDGDEEDGIPDDLTEGGVSDSRLSEEVSVGGDIPGLFPLLGVTMFNLTEELNLAFGQDGWDSNNFGDCDLYWHVGPPYGEDLTDVQVHEKMQKIAQKAPPEEQLVVRDDGSLEKVFL